MKKKVYVIAVKATLNLNYAKKIDVQFNVTGTSEEDARHTANIILNNASLSFSRPDCIEVGIERTVASNPRVNFHGRVYQPGSIRAVRIYEKSLSFAVYTNTNSSSGGDLFAEWGENFKDSFKKDVDEFLSQLTLME